MVTYNRLHSQQYANFTHSNITNNDSTKVISCFGWSQKIACVSGSVRFQNLKFCRYIEEATLNQMSYCFTQNTKACQCCFKGSCLLTGQTTFDYQIPNFFIVQLLSVYIVHNLSFLSNTNCSTGQVFATDNDTDTWNAEILYSLRFFGNDLQFSIDNKTGVISSYLSDLDTSNTFLFAVVAHDRGILCVVNC